MFQRLVTPLFYISFPIPGVIYSDRIALKGLEVQTNRGQLAIFNEDYTVGYFGNDTRKFIVTMEYNQGCQIGVLLLRQTVLSSHWTDSD